MSKKSKMFKNSKNFKVSIVSNENNLAPEQTNFEEKNTKETKRIFSKTNIIKDSILGLTMGSNSIVYGSSTSLIAFQLDGYKNLIEKVCSLFMPKNFKEFLSNLVTLLPFFVTFIISAIIMYSITSALSFAGYELAIIFAFIGINIISLLLTLFLRKNRPTSLFSRNKFKESSFRKFHWIGLILILFIVVGISFVAKFAWNAGFLSDHINFAQATQLNESPLISSLISKNTIETSYALQILFAGLLCGLTTFIPGLSGSFMLAVIGSNGFINTALRYAFGGYVMDQSIQISTNWAWSTIVIAFIGLILGFIASAFITKWILSRSEDSFKTTAFALALTLPIVTLISLSTNDYQIINSNVTLLGITIGMICAPIILGSIYFGVYGKYKKISFNWIWTSEEE